MSVDSIREQSYWLQQQTNAAFTIIVVTASFAVLKLLASYIQHCDKKKVVYIDTIILTLAGLGACIPLCVLAIGNAKAYEAYNRSSNDADTLSQYAMIWKNLYGFSVIYPVASVIPKLSICVLYLHIFGVYLWMARITKLLIAFLTVNAIAWLIPSVIVCRPISVFWSFGSHQGHCINTSVFGTWISLPHIITDLMILALPFPILLKTQLSFSKKVGLILTFLAASHGIAAACVRLGFYISRTYVERPGLNESVKSIVLENMFTMFEPCSYLIASCMPSLPPLLVLLQRSLSNGLASLFRPSQAATSISSNRLPKIGLKESPTTPHVDMHITDIGNLGSLAREGDAIYRSPLSSV